MTTPKDGGPAFPTEVMDKYGEWERKSGMSLRDWFAGQALIHGNWENFDYSIAVHAYRMADAMIAARSK